MFLCRTNFYAIGLPGRTPSSPAPIGKPSRRVGCSKSDPFVVAQRPVWMNRSNLPAGSASAYCVVSRLPRLDFQPPAKSFLGKRGGRQLVVFIVYIKDKNYWALALNILVLAKVTVYSPFIACWRFASCQGDCTGVGDDDKPLISLDQYSFSRRERVMECKPPKVEKT